MEVPEWIKKKYPQSKKEREVSPEPIIWPPGLRVQPEPAYKQEYYRILMKKMNENESQTKNQSRESSVTSGDKSSLTKSKPLKWVAMPASKKNDGDSSKKPKKNLLRPVERIIYCEKVPLNKPSAPPKDSPVDKNHELESVDEDDDKPIPEISSEDDIFFVGIPANIIRFARQIKEAVIPEELMVKRCFRIFVTEVFSPYKFWFQLQSFDLDLKKMRHDLKVFYTDHLDEYKMTAFDAVKGRCCAVYWYQIWYRGEILSGPGDSEESETEHQKDDSYALATVFFVDYGTVSNVFLKDLRHIIDRFGELPRLAHRGRMALVEPPDGNIHWSLEPKKNSTNFILDMVSNNRSLRAELHAFETEERIHHLKLFDDFIPYTVEELSINQETELAGLCKIIKPDEENWPHTDELYPTFDLIESNEYPTLDTIVSKPNRDEFLEQYWTPDVIQKYYREENRIWKLENRNLYEKKLKVRQLKLASLPSKTQTMSNQLKNLQLQEKELPSKPIRKATEFRWPNSLKFDLLNFNEVTEDEFKKAWRTHLDVQHFFEKNVIKPTKTLEESNVGRLFKKLKEISRK